MFHTCSFLVYGVVAAFVLSPLLVDERTLELASNYRIAVFYRLLALRNKYLLTVDSELKEYYTSDVETLYQLLSFDRSIFELNKVIDENNIEKHRCTIKRLLTWLYPRKTQNCYIYDETIFFNNSNIKIYHVQPHKSIDWRTLEQPLILYFHGGGFAFGDINIYSGIACYQSTYHNMAVLHVDLDRAPELPLKDLIRKIILVYEYLLLVDPNIPERLIGMGDSSGGMLWIYLLQWLIANNKVIPRGVVLHSPWPHLNFFSEYSAHDYGIEDFLSAPFLLQLRQLAIGKHVDWDTLTDAERREVSPHKNAYEGFPPVYITAGTHEVLINEIRDMADNMILAHVNIILDEGELLGHTYALFHVWLSKSQISQSAIRQWIKKQLK